MIHAYNLNKRKTIVNRPKSIWAQLLRNKSTKLFSARFLSCKLKKLYISLKKEWLYCIFWYINYLVGFYNEESHHVEHADRLYG